MLERTCHNILTCRRIEAVWALAALSTTKHTATKLLGLPQCHNLIITNQNNKCTFIHKLV